MNFSNGTNQEKRETYERIRKVDEYVGILADIQGPKLRVGRFKDDNAYILNVGQEVKVYEREIIGDQEQFSVPLPGFIKSMNKGGYFFVNDGIIKIEVKKKEKDHIIGEVISDHPDRVMMKTRIGGIRIVDMLTGDQLPRIC